MFNLVKGKIRSESYMKTISGISKVIFLCLFLVYGGCEPSPPTVEPPAKTDDGFNVSAYALYAPVSIKIMPLTEINRIRDDEGGSKINIFVSLLDSFDCQVKSPGIFRFELYERIPRSGEPKGRRIVIWPSIDLTEAAENNNYWRDFLGAYEFKLDFELQRNQTYILQVTCLCPNGKRLSAELVLKSEK